MRPELRPLVGMEARRMAEAEDVPRTGRHVDLLTNKAFSWKLLGSLIIRRPSIRAQESERRIKQSRRDSPVRNQAGSAPDSQVAE